MRLSRVVISGFKTFAKRSEVVLDERMTAIVGPNGSGKSNFVDAIRWGLGETNARELRGARMDEVIYAGGAGRGRMGLAEVELVLDNSDGRLLREDAEVSVGRRVARDGNSEFRLNGERVRLRDIERVLGPTGLTQSGYAVVAQHDIDGIIQATPPQRRALVEQAAGVRAFKAACDDTIERVRRTETGLRRLDDFLADAEPRLAELAGQCEQALVQRELTARLAELRGSLAREEWRAARARLKQARRRLEVAESRAAAATEAAAGFGAGLDVQRRLVAERREAQRAARARFEAARLAAERATGDARRWADRRSQGALQRSMAAAQLSAAVDDVARSRSVFEALEPAGSDPEPGGDAVAQRLASVRELHATARARLDDAEARRSSSDNALGSATAARAAAVAGLREALARVNGIDESLAALEVEAVDVRERIDTALAGGSDPRAEVAKAVLAGRLSARRLRSCFEVVDAADAMAIEAALERDLDGWLTDEVTSAIELFRADGSREQVISAGLAEAAPASATPGARPALSAITVTHLPALGALGALLGSTWLVPDLATARELVGAVSGTAILPDGTLVSAVATRGGGRPGSAGAARAAPHRQRLEAITAQRAARVAARVGAEAALASAEAARAASETTFAQAHDASEEARRLVAASRRDLDEAVSSLREAEHAVAQIRLVAEDRRRRREAARQALTSAEVRSAAAELRLLAVESEVLIAVVRGQGVRDALDRATREVGAASNLEATTGPPLAEAERAFAALDAERAEVAIAQARADDEAAAARREVVAAEAAVAQLAEALRGDEADDGPEPEAQDAERAEREILRVERRISALGPVNALAPEQLEKLGDRAQTARNDRDDLGGACADLRALCAHLAAASDRRFDAVFGAVSQHFEELFGELFPAGKASLRLEHPPAPPEGDDHEQPAAPGVEIMAQPPGKRLQPLSLLSGGERALTALAVILALQQVNPSPFYVFDEVDAALDDSNVVRFTRMLARLGAQQQFIVVTHNHITMAAADALYGVTIDSEGMSSILSVRLAARDEGPQGRIVAIPQAAVEAAV